MQDVDLVAPDGVSLCSDPSVTLKMQVVGTFKTSSNTTHRHGVTSHTI